MARAELWAMNAGLALMVGLSLLPIGLMQAYASIETWLWYARSAEFLQQPLIESDGCASPVTRSP